MYKKVRLTCRNFTRQELSEDEFFTYKWYSSTSAWEGCAASPTLALLRGASTQELCYHAHLGVLNSAGGTADSPQKSPRQAPSAGRKLRASRPEFNAHWSPAFESAISSRCQRTTDLILTPLF
jgi:hypothetical protein